MLTDAEHRVLALYCLDHVVAVCPTCGGGFRLTETAVDLSSMRRGHYCRTCHTTLTDAIRLHILSCPTIAAALDELLETSRMLRKASEQKIATAERLAAESEARVQRLLKRLGLGEEGR